MTGETMNGMADNGFDPSTAYPGYGMAGAYMPMGQQPVATPMGQQPMGVPSAQSQPQTQPIPGVMQPQPQMAPMAQMGLPPLMLGTYTPKIDAKGRMALPAKLRSQLGTGLVMARGQERCVYLLPAMEFRRIAMQIQRTSMGDKAARDYLRVFLSGAVDQDPDKQGRVLVPQMLRDYANLGDDIVVIGVGTRAEIWNREAWEAYLADKEQGYADIADDVLPEVGL